MVDAMPVLALWLSVLGTTFVYYFFPALWLSLTHGYHSSLPRNRTAELVAARNPYRESGPPENMARLILLRQKMQASSRRRRNSTRATSRPPARILSKTPFRQSTPWLRIPRPFAKQRL
ncbi:hypothetical protein DL96DRAFT_1593435 [Flagelloscypha sp. PMI_526]|nr:hypothetical protein DL96DRAFT_1593435 [Flagelloscypha sp. PMI_526]